MKSRIKKVVLQPDRTPLAVKRIDTGWVISLPEHKPDPDVSVIALDLQGALQVDTRPVQEQGGAIRIPASSFDTQAKTVRMEYNGYHRVAHIGHWTNPEEELRSAFTVVEPGTFVAEITYACDKAAEGSRATVRIGDQSLSLVSEDTGGWSGRDYRTVEMGKVSLQPAGRQAIRVVPDPVGWQQIALKEVILTPVTSNSESQ